ncbi:lysophospholipid acyltransferase family protein [Caulobacter sp. RL271]|jgi:1-acyl-sn-glycerol-3-phosphate acyltransferase|uniref:1-acyl-sn-glycerol-3-phosphate acyltransferase n=1 Tax=Caulobacter segnis TaxID=88688 RepID=A0ABY4ZLL4_9CAUL|nr:lysophospholipid acyltransferase family protein [Caulobacter segnis]USQ93692.1 1-acyl-sn-glycerol-3-phosphate acyltransferase [Caulobacter segnis]
MRSALFNAYYWVLSIFYGLSAAFAALAPGRDAVTFVLRLYSRRMLTTLDALAGVKVQLKGLENLPPGPCIIAAKHHSWGDGFVMFAHVDNLSFVTGDHLERFPLVGAILKKFGAIVVDSCGGPEARKALSESAAQVAAEGRRILIYPEGHLAAPGERFRYRTGVYYMSKDFGLPVVPVATNLGCFWKQREKKKSPGTATVEFLPPLPRGLEKDAFMQRMEAVIEGRTNELIAQATGRPVTPSVLVEWNGRTNVATPPVEAPAHG